VLTESHRIDVWCIGGPKDCQKIGVRSSVPYLDVVEPPDMHSIRAYGSGPQEMESVRKSTYHEALAVIDGRDQVIYIHETEQCTPLVLQLIEGLEVFKDNGSLLELMSREVACELPRDVWPNRCRPATRMAAYSALFVKRLVGVAMTHQVVVRI